MLSALGSMLPYGGVTPVPPSPGLVPASLRRGAGFCGQGQSPLPAVSPPRRPCRALESEATVCGSQSREESQAEVGDKLREMTKLPSLPNTPKLGWVWSQWPGEAAHNYQFGS